MEKFKYGCLKYTALFTIFICFMVYGFSKLAENTFNLARQEIRERFLGSGNKNNGTIGKDSVIIIPKIETKKDSLVVDKEDCSIIPIEIKNGATYVIASVNGVDMKFILDTGCTNVQLTVVEFEFLKHNDIADDSDLGEKVKCKYANNDEGECYTFNMKTFKIGDIEINDVTCTVEENSDAPRLLGQAVLQKLGEVTIDYNKNIIKIKR